MLGRYITEHWWDLEYQPEVTIAYNLVLTECCPFYMGPDRKLRESSGQVLGQKPPAKGRHSDHVPALGPRELGPRELQVGSLRRRRLL